MEIQIINRIPAGVAIGWSYYSPDENHNYEEITFHLLLIDLRFVW